jgi:hypothetical protein
VSYGFEIKNAAGAVIANAERPVFALSSTQTLSGATSSLSGVFRYTIPPNDELIFFRIPAAGSFFGRGALNITGVHGWWSNMSSVQIRRARRVTDLGAAPTTGYGLVAKNEAGQVTFRADATTFVISDVITLPFDTSQHFACDKEWFCIPNAWSGIVSVSGSTISYRGTGVWRQSSTTIRSAENAPSGVSLPPFIVLAAP